MTNQKQHDENGVITTLGELLSCPRCGEPYIKEIQTYLSDSSTGIYKPNCECIKQKIRISVG